MKHNLLPDGTALPEVYYETEDGRIVWMAELVASLHRGYPLTSREYVVHLNGDPLDNTEENIEVRTLPDGDEFSPEEVKALEVAFNWIQKLRATASPERQ